MFRSLKSIACGFLIGLCGGCVKSSTQQFYFYDWTAVTAKTFSIGPESQRVQVEFTVASVAHVPPFQSPPVIPPYNVTTTFDTRIKGMVNGKPATLEAASSSLAALKLGAGSILTMEVGEKHSELVFSVVTK